MNYLGLWEDFCKGQYRKLWCFQLQHVYMYLCFQIWPWFPSPLTLAVGPQPFIHASNAIVIWGFEFTSDLPLSSFMLFIHQINSFLASWDKQTLLSKFFCIGNSRFFAFLGTCNGERPAELLLQDNLVFQSAEKCPALSLPLLREATDADLLLNLISPVEEWASHVWSP